MECVTLSETPAEESPVFHAAPSFVTEQEVAFAEAQLIETLLPVFWSTRTPESCPFALISAVGTMTVMGTCAYAFAEPEGHVTV